MPRSLVQSTVKACQSLPQRAQSSSLLGEANGHTATWRGQFRARDGATNAHRDAAYVHTSTLSHPST